MDNLDYDFGGAPNLFTINVDGTPRDVVGVGGKDGTYYVIDRDGVNARSGVSWDDPDPAGLPYWATNVVPGGDQGGVIATAAVDQTARRVHFSTAPGTSVFTPQRPTVHALDLDTGAILWENTTEVNADASFASTSAIPGVVFVGGALSGALRIYDAAIGTKLAAVPMSFVLASPPAIVDGHVLVGGGVGVRTANPNDPSDIVSHTASDVTALCVPHSLACDGDQDGFDFPEDCDDQNPQVHPGAREIPDDGVDQDCDGFDAHARDACLQGGSAGSDRRGSRRRPCSDGVAMPVCVARWQPGPNPPRVPGVRAADHPRGDRRQDGTPALQTAAEAVDLRPAAKGRVLPGAPRLRQALLSRRTDEGVREHEPVDPQHRGRRDQLCRYRLHARPADEHAHGDRHTDRYAGRSDSDPHPAARIVGGDSSAGDRPCRAGGATAGPAG